MMKNTDHIFDQILQVCEVLEGSINERLDLALVDYPEAVEMRPALKTALWLQMRRPAVEPRPGFVSASRSRVMTRIRQEKAAQAKPAKRGFRLWPAKAAMRIVVVAVVIFGILLSSTGVAYASQGSLPGESLYAVKIGIENAQLGLTRADVKDARLHADFAGTRLDEVGALIQNENLSLIDDTVDNFTNHVGAVAGLVKGAADSDRAAIEDVAKGLERTLVEKGQQLAALQDGASAVAQEATLDVLASVEQGVETLRAAVGKETGQTPESVQPTDTPEPTPTITETPEPTPTETVEPTPTDVPTATPTVEPSPTATPTVVIKPTQQSAPVVPDTGGDPSDDEKDKEDKEDKDDNPDDGNNGGGNDDKVYNPNKPPKDE
ncbi:MAG: hypothetical protein JXB38_15260 [Anaerolineales bacterium]|nr:hypothetical protein [Anaerolineales bacterium]